MSDPVQRDVFDVAIVGFGPTGAVLAALLGQAGLRCWVGDRSTEVYDKPRAISLDHEILRVFQQIGVVDAVLQHVEPFTPSEYFGVDGQLIKRLTMVEPPYPLGYTPSNVFTQPPVERALRERVAALPNVTVELGVDVTAVEQDADGVTLRGAQRRRRRRARCAHAIWSPATALAAACATRPASSSKTWTSTSPGWWSTCCVNEAGLASLPRTSVQYCEPERPCHAGDRSRQPPALGDLAQAGRGPGAGGDARAHLGAARALAEPDRRHAVAPGVATASMRWWRSSGAPAASSSPATRRTSSRRSWARACARAMRDVANLAWKLGAVLRGDVQGAAADALLDSYGDERKAHVRELTSRIKADRRRDLRARSGAGPRARRAAAGRGRRHGARHAAPGRHSAPADRPPLTHATRRQRRAVPAALAGSSRRRTGACGSTTSEAGGSGWRLVLAGDARNVLHRARPALAGLAATCACSRSAVHGTTPTAWPATGSNASAPVPRWCGRTTTSTAWRRVPAQVAALLCDAAERLS